MNDSDIIAVGRHEDRIALVHYKDGRNYTDLIDYEDAAYVAARIVSELDLEAIGNPDTVEVEASEGEAESTGEGQWCDKCGYEWEYNGEKKTGEMITCPNCLGKTTMTKEASA